MHLELGSALAAQLASLDLPYAEASLKLVEQNLFIGSYSCCCYCRGAKAIDELTTGLLLRPEEAAMLVQAAGIRTGKAGLAEKELLLELLLRQLATATEAVGTLSRKRCGARVDNLEAAKLAAAWQAASVALAAGLAGHLLLTPYPESKEQR